ncbi:dihydrofolate reductase [Enterococcus sp. JM4C]|uniref:dihydrofolate reductase n=1 Tax=Candidatus Enterococcus huntleyi TaxID=1857217 RepID=UPI00137B50E7|nr:dihydrofolate reductase [Enterococcus sp. JM4C]KAF1296794.1 dihydrofolate reductase [Enterococcus sp. JM4C]
MFLSIWAQDRNGLIGKEGLLPWHLPNDMNFFLQHTVDSIVAMGRKTYQGLDYRSEKYRHILVITCQKELPVRQNAEVISSVTELLNYAEHCREDIYISGGSRLYKEMLPYTSVIWRTLIDAEFEGDTYIEEMDFSAFELAEEIQGIVDEENLYPHVFQKWVRKADAPIQQ